MKLARLIALLVLAWVMFPAHAGAQDKTAQVEAIVVDHTVVLKWTASTDVTCTGTPVVCTPNSDPIAYNVLWSNTNGGPYSVLGSTTALTYMDLDVVSGNTYYYVVVAVDTVNGAQSGYSNQVSATIP